jgi:hypothetical protein
MRKISFVTLLLFVILFGVSCKEKEREDWNTYRDEKLNFSIQYPKDWVAEFWKYKSEPGPYFGRLADYSKGMIIEFASYKLDQDESLDDFVKHTVDKHDKFFFKKSKKLDTLSVIRYGAHLFLRDGESFVLRQFVKIEGDNIIDLMVDLPKDSIEKKDEKYKLIIEIMDTFKKIDFGS